MNKMILPGAAPQTRTPVRAVFFDIGGTLVYPHPSFPGLLAQVCREDGLAVTPQDAQRVEPAVWARIAQRQDAGRGFSLSPERSQAFWLWVYQVFLEELGYDEVSRDSLPGRLYRTFTRIESYRLYDDALPTLARLKGEGFALGVISNWEGWLARLMAHLEIAHYFDVSVVSGQAGIEKPDPEIFLRALNAANVRPEEALHVGDNPRDDVEGAQAVGIRGVLLDRLDRFAPVLPGSHPEPSQPEVIRTLLELPGLLGLT
jgi:putative hydrolase of the HAD superfamily